jgi:hypothetical protein
MLKLRDMAAKRFYGKSGAEGWGRPIKDCAASLRVDAQVPAHARARIGIDLRPFFQIEGFEGNLLRIKIWREEFRGEEENVYVWE